MNYLAPEHCHESLIKKAPLSLAFDKNTNYEEWRNKVKAKLLELMGDFPEKTDPKLEIEYEKDFDNFKEIRFTFFSEEYAKIPCHLLIPMLNKEKYPLAVCLQGHSKGMHISLGRVKYEGDEKSIAGARDFGIQAVAEGYCALIMEQRCFGERSDARSPEKHTFQNTCTHAALNAMLLGRTLMGERVWDTMRAIDIMESFPEVDMNKIICMGNSGGGTTAFYTACLDKRITAAMPSCSVCTFEASIMKVDHCSCNYIPNIMKYFDMPDLACLIAPRPLVVVAGKEDEIFPLYGVTESFNKIEEIYNAFGYSDNCKLVIGNGGHRFYPEAWGVLSEIL